MGYEFSTGLVFSLAVRRCLTQHRNGMETTVHFPARNLVCHQGIEYVRLEDGDVEWAEYLRSVRGVGQCSSVLSAAVLNMLDSAWLFKQDAG